MKFAYNFIKKSLLYKVRLRTTNRWNNDIRAFGTKLIFKVKGTK